MSLKAAQQAWSHVDRTQAWGKNKSQKQIFFFSLPLQKLISFPCVFKRPFPALLFFCPALWQCYTFSPQGGSKCMFHSDVPVNVQNDAKWSESKSGGLHSTLLHLCLIHSDVVYSDGEGGGYRGRCVSAGGT